MNSSETSNPKWVQLRTSAALLLVICATWVAVDALAWHGRGPLQAQRLERWQDSNSLYSYRLGFADFMDRLLLDELPHADHSMGGAFFFGASPMQVSLMTWELPPDQQERVHNYAVNTANHTQQGQFLRYLVDYEGLLSADAGDSLVVLGAWQGCGLSAGEDGSDFRRFFASLFERHGLYRYDPERGIRPTPIPALLKTLHIERIRCSNYLQQFAPGRLNRNLPPLHVQRFEGHDETEYREFWDRLWGPDWEADLAAEMKVFGQTIDYVRENGGRAAVVLLPLGSWFDGYAQAEAYTAQITALCETKSVPLTDLSDFLTDDELMDHSHANYQGQKKLHDRLVRLTADDST